jgi:uncharacterized protein
VDVGVLSDTHGLLRPEAVRALEGVEHLLHAGDVGSPHVLEELFRLAPVTAVWGNVDGADLRVALPQVAHVELAGVTVVVAHTAETALRSDPAAALVVFGHSHRPSVERSGERLLLNPGSAGPRRFRLPVCVARLTIEANRIEARLVELAV